MPEPEIIAAFANAESARQVVRDLEELNVETDLIVTPVMGAWYAPDDFEKGQAKTITGALLGGIWGMLLAALLINFVAVNPSLLIIGGLLVFGSVGGMAVGGFIAGGSSTPKVQRGNWASERHDPGSPEAEAFVTVHANAGQLETACRILQSRHPMDIYRA
jgi:hypothetical protein